MRLHKLREKIRARERLNIEDGIALYRDMSLGELGRLADERTQAEHHNAVFYNRNRHINPTNVCVKSCKFCAFSRKPGDEGAYEYSIDEIIERAQTVVDSGATEVHMVGGLHPRWNFQHYLNILSSVKSKFPSLHIKAFTAVEIDWLSQKARLSIKETLETLRAAGLDSMPGGGAEIFHPDIRNQICDTKTDADRWLMIHRTAHQIGLRSNCTMLYGHVENVSHRVDHMIRLRELQDETGGFNVFIPLAFQPDDNQLGRDRYTSGEDDLRTLAVARLMLDNFRHIKAYWIMLGHEIAELGMHFGANDLDGTVTEEKISRMAGGRSGMALTSSDIQHIIKKSERIPVERDTLYNPIQVPHSERSEAPESRKGASSVTTFKNVTERSYPLDLLFYRLTHTASSELSEADIHILTNLATPHQLVALLESPVFKYQSSPYNALELYWNSGASFIENAKAEHLDLNLSFVEKKSFNSCDDLQEAVALVKADFPKIRSILGTNTLMQILSKTQDSGLSFLTMLKNRFGIEHVGSSYGESEVYITTQEKIEFHRTCTAAGLSTSTKIELSAPFTGSEPAFFSDFVRKCFNLRRELVNSRSPVTEIQRVSIEASPNSFLTSIEYLRAVALARIILPLQVSLATPALNLPCFRRAPEGVTGRRHPAFKYLSVLPSFGIDNLGVFSAGATELDDIINEYKRSVPANSYEHLGEKEDLGTQVIHNSHVQEASE